VVAKLFSSVRRFERLCLIPGLAGLIIALDALWTLAAGSTGTLAYGLIDEPAHLATCAIAVSVLATTVSRPLPGRFALAALLASVAIDLDHLPGYFGFDLLTVGSPRPYTHSLACGVVLVLVSLVVRRPGPRAACLGAAFGISTHLFRDLATGPGIPLLWPVADQSTQIPYVAFAATLAGTVLLALAGRFAGIRRTLQGATAVTLMLAFVALAQPRVAHAATPPPVALGAYIPYSGQDPEKIESYGALVGRQPAIVSSYKDWTKPLIEPAELDAVWERGAMPMITWEPWDQHDESMTFPLSAIAAGCCDEFIAESARAAAAWGQPMLLRFAHEMNGGWYPWGKGRPGSSAAAYKAAWRHVVAIFRANGASNVKWVWTPYVMVGHRFRFASYYPGDHWVDWAGLDGLNGGSVFGWRSFREIFSDSYSQLVRITHRPLILAEVGSTEAGGSKARWLSRGLRRGLPRMPHIRALVWWADGSDYRGNFAVDSSGTALHALRVALGRPEFSADRTQFLATPERLSPGRRRASKPSRHTHGRR
jgi:membrane-bound metal-dependent hydrolase YbcI (DUF457 family)